MNQSQLLVAGLLAIGGVLAYQDSRKSKAPATPVAGSGGCAGGDCAGEPATAPSSDTAPAHAAVAAPVQDIPAAPTPPAASLRERFGTVSIAGSRSGGGTTALKGDQERQGIILDGVPPKTIDPVTLEEAARLGPDLDGARASGFLV